MPKQKWAGLAPAFFGIMQAVGHGLVFPRIAGDKYSPGFLASFFLHVPIGVSYVMALNAEGNVTSADIIKCAAYTLAFAVIAIGGPNIGSNNNSPYVFTQEQMGPHDVPQRA